MIADSVAVLFARADSNYYAVAGCDVWDEQRDALKWRGDCPVVAHPPCRGWGRLRHFARPKPGEQALAIWAVDQVRRHGGVLEHPSWSSLWSAVDLPSPGTRDRYNGWTLPVDQFWWGHRARKSTWLYIVGCESRDVPAMPYRIDEPICVVQSRKRAGASGYRPHITKAEREHTPPAFAAWLADLAGRCGEARE